MLISAPGLRLYCGFSAFCKGFYFDLKIHVSFFVTLPAYFSQFLTSLVWFSAFAIMLGVSLFLVFILCSVILLRCFGFFLYFYLSDYLFHIRVIERLSPVSLLSFLHICAFFRFPSYQLSVLSGFLPSIHALIILSKFDFRVSRFVYHSSVSFLFHLKTDRIF